MCLDGTTSEPVTWLDKHQVPKSHACRSCRTNVRSEAPVQTVVAIIDTLNYNTQTKHLTKQAGVPRTQPACIWRRATNSVPRGLRVSYLVRVHQSGVWEMERGDEQSDTLALHPVTIKVVGDDPGHKVLAGAGPAVEGERQRLVGLRVVDKTLDGFQNHRLSQVLPVELRLKVPRQTCTCVQRRECMFKDGGTR